MKKVTIEHEDGTKEVYKCNEFILIAFGDTITRRSNLAFINLMYASVMIQEDARLTFTESMKRKDKVISYDSTSKTDYDVS